MPGMCCGNRLITRHDEQNHLNVHSIAKGYIDTSRISTWGALAVLTPSAISIASLASDSFARSVFGRRTLEISLGVSTLANMILPLADILVPSYRFKLSPMINIFRMMVTEALSGYTVSQMGMSNGKEPYSLLIRSLVCISSIKSSFFFFREPYLVQKYFNQMKKIKTTSMENVRDKAITLIIETTEDPNKAFVDRPFPPSNLPTFFINLSSIAECQTIIKMLEDQGTRVETCLIRAHGEQDIIRLSECDSTETGIREGTVIHKENIGQFAAALLRTKKDLKQVVLDSCETGLETSTTKSVGRCMSDALQCTVYCPSFPAVGMEIKPNPFAVIYRNENLKDWPAIIFQNGKLIGPAESLLSGNTLPAPDATSIDILDC